MRGRKTTGPLLIALLIGALAAARADDPPVGRRADQAALKPYGTLVGSWRGVGQPQRSSPRGAWRESGAWAWSLKDDSAALVLTIDDGKYLQSACLRPAGEGAFRLDATLADGSARSFAGKAGPRDVLVLDAHGPPADGPRRITLRPLHDIRFTLLLERQDPARGTFDRLAEVGYTREGVAFAAGDAHPACIVTEGRGTIPVGYRGKSYYVCCSGCKELFEADPAAIVAEAEARARGGAKP